MRKHGTLRSPRLARKRRKKAARKAALLLALALAALGGVLYAFSRPTFRVRTIDVAGANRVSEGAVRSVAENVFAGAYFGVIPKTHALLLPRDELKKSLTKTFPALSGASISLRTLSSVRISVRERAAVARWCALSCVLIDETGFAFAEAPRAASEGQYRIERAGADTALGTNVIEKERLAALLSFLMGLERLGIAPERIMLRNAGEFAAEVAGGAQLLVREGDGDDALRRLQTLLLEGVVPKRGDELAVRYLDLRYGNKIYFK